MVRVKSEAFTKAAVKAPRKQTALKGDSSKTPKNGKSNKYSGGNSYCLRSTPAWQKPITSFFTKNWSPDVATEDDISKKDVAACSSASSSEPGPSCSKEGFDLVESEVDPDSNADAGNEVSVSDGNTKVKKNKELKSITKNSGKYESDDTSV